MKLSLAEYRLRFATCYKSPAQITRVVTENWFKENMYCPACTGDHLIDYRANRPVMDFFCDECHENFQLKAKKDRLGRKILDGQYDTLVGAVKQNLTPNFIFMTYRGENWMLQSLFVIPKYFITLSVIEKRKALSAQAKRRDYVGCNILFYRLPEMARIYVVRDGLELPRTKVAQAWKDISFLSGVKNYRSRGWTSDMMFCVDSIKKDEFSLKDCYQFEHYLAELHPENHRIRPKIRQQLQILRDRGVIEFLGKGVYRKTR